MDENVLVQDCSIDELVRFLIERIKLTNGLEFVSPKDMHALRDQLSAELWHVYRRK